MGSVVVIYGSGFGATQGGSSVEFTRDNGRSVDGAVVSWSDVRIEVEVPNHAVTGDVAVVVSGVSSNAVPFTVGDPPLDPPVIDAVTPDAAPYGSTIAVSGSGFGATQGANARVEFWGPDSSLLRGEVVSWSDTLIEVVVPDGSVEGYVRVWLNDATASNPVYFVPSDPPASGEPPVIDSLSTYAAPPGDVVWVYGSNFGTPTPDSYVFFPDKQGDRIQATVVSWSDTAIEVEVPRGAVAGYVGVVVEQFWVSNGVYFVPSVSPVLDSLSVTQGESGDQVVFYGSGFGRRQGSGYVVFGDLTATVVSWSDTEIVAVVPDGVQTGYAGVVQNDVYSNGILFTPAGSPVVSGLSTQVAQVGEEVVITGSGFGSVPGSVMVAGDPVAPNAWSDTEVRFNVPADAQTGYVGVEVNGVYSNGVYLLPVPRIDAISSWWGPVGSQLTITGEGFGQDQAGMRVTFGSQDMNVVSWSPTTIVAEVPAGVEEGYVGVWREWAASNGIWFLAITQASISSVDTTTVSPGQTITITGSDFGPEEPNSAVMIGGTWICPTVSWSDTVIVAQVPQGAQSGYLGVWKKGVASNGVWVEVNP